MLDALAQVKPIAGPRLRNQIADSTELERADAILDKVKDVKGRFAQELAELIADDVQPITVPTYLEEAIEWVTNNQESGASGSESGPPTAD
jgi:hypothetical protein